MGVVPSMPMIVRLLIGFLLVFGLTAAMSPRSVASAVPPAAEPLQFYVFSFTDTPVEEAAQDVIGGALARDLTLDPALEGLVTFRADGWYSEQALVQDFGTSLLDQDIALVRTGPGAYAVVPRANVPMLMARGGTLMRLPEPTSARPATPVPASDGSAVEARSAPWWDDAFFGLLLFFTGAAAGAAALFGGQTAYRRAQGNAVRLSPPLLRLTDQRLRLMPPGDIVEGDPDLIIPRFEDRR